MISKLHQYSSVQLKVSLVAELNKKRQFSHLSDRSKRKISKNQKAYRLVKIFVVVRSFHVTSSCRTVFDSIWIVLVNIGLYVILRDDKILLVIAFFCVCTGTCTFTLWDFASDSLCFLSGSCALFFGCLELCPFLTKRSNPQISKNGFLIAIGL